MYIYDDTISIYTLHTYREALFKAIGEERGRLEVELKRREELLITHREWRSSEC